MWRRPAPDAPGPGAVRWARTLGLAAAVAIGGWASAQAAPPLARLPALGLDPGAVTVSGLSSGGYMAVQFQLAHSASVAGAAVLAGGPYGCSRGLVSTASLVCSCPSTPNAVLRGLEAIPGLGCEVLEAGAYLRLSLRAAQANRGRIDDTSGLARHRVWLFSGGADRVVARPLVDALAASYEAFGVPPAQLARVHLEDAGHGLPSAGAAQACSASTSPYLNQCQFDAPGALLAWLYPPSGDRPAVSAVEAAAGSLRRFRQTRYRQAPFDGLDTTGWLYVPASCERAEAHCRLHVAFHGCQQAQAQALPGGGRFGTRFVDGAGYNRWAEGSGIVVLYPQVLASRLGSVFNPYRFNPEGCWDFWGYTERYAALAPSFATREAPQIAAVRAMVDDLLRPR